MDAAFAGIITIIAIALIVTMILKKEKAQESKSKYFKKILLSAPEQVIYHRLKASMPEHEILAQVAFSQMIGSKGGSKKENFSKYGKARQKVADFVICDKSFNIIGVVEIDDKTHNTEKDEGRDKMLLEAGIPTVRWKATNLPSEEEIKQKLSSLNAQQSSDLSPHISKL